MTEHIPAPREKTRPTAREIRSLAEIASAVSMRNFHRHLHSGDGHPVVIAPSFMTSDIGSAVMRQALRRAGYAAYGWEQGLNTGLREKVYRNYERHVLDLVSRHGRKASLVGWSLGGIYARSLAHRRPEYVRQVITLGSPVNIPEMRGVSGPVAKLYEMLNPGALSDPMLSWRDEWKRTPNVPSTAMYSASDGIVDWQYCVHEQPGPQAENLRVPASHMGMTHNLAVLYALSDRLAQAEGKWQPFSLSGIRQHLYAVSHTLQTA
ncbi:hypothetical protein [Spongiibacter tropicus]|uniref:hypothetical protein n=1 Tax=Spongiibacter tropicus TaxID=454602 RepID=UPI0035BE3CCA